MKSVKSVGQNGEGEASTPAPLQGERGGSKLKGCDSQDRGLTDKICEIREIRVTRTEDKGKNHG